MKAKQLLAILKASGIQPTKVEKNCAASKALNTNLFRIDFFKPEWAEAVEPAAVYAARIQAALPQAVVKETSNTIAPWREGRPVINAFILLEVKHVSQSDVIAALTGNYGAPKEAVVNAPDVA